MTGTWYLFDSIKDLIDQLGDASAIRRANRHLAAIASTVADVLASASRKTLLEGASKAKATLDEIHAGADVDEESPAFLAGRAAAITDVLAFAANRRAADNIEREAKPYLATLRALYEGPLSNVELARHTGAAEETECRNLGRVRALGLVDTEKEGRENVNRLTALGRSLFEEGILRLNDEQDDYDMGKIVRRTPPRQMAAAKQSELPRLNLAK